MNTLEWSSRSHGRTESDTRICLTCFAVDGPAVGANVKVQTKLGARKLLVGVRLHSGQHPGDYCYPCFRNLVTSSSAFDGIKREVQMILMKHEISVGDVSQRSTASSADVEDEDSLMSALDE